MTNYQILKIRDAQQTHYCRKNISISFNIPKKAKGLVEFTCRMVIMYSSVKDDSCQFLIQDQLYSESQDKNNYIARKRVYLI